MQNAYITLVDKSKVQEFEITEVESLLNYYVEITKKTGEQLNFPYDEFAWPYSCERREVEEGTVLVCKALQLNYNMIAFGIDRNKPKVLQITIHEHATEGDKAKANEMAKFIAKKLESKLKLFNGRTMYYYKR